MPLESRSYYGYYGVFGGVTGEVAPKTHKSGWEFHSYLLITDEPEWKIPRVSLKAMDIEHAMKQAKKYCKVHDCQIVELRRD